MRASADIEKELSNAKAQAAESELRNNELLHQLDAMSASLDIAEKALQQEKKENSKLRATIAKKCTMVDMNLASQTLEKLSGLLIPAESREGYNEALRQAMLEQYTTNSRVTSGLPTSSVNQANEQQGEEQLQTTQNCPIQLRDQHNENTITWDKHSQALKAINKELSKASALNAQLDQEIARLKKEVETLPELQNQITTLEQQIESAGIEKESLQSEKARNDQILAEFVISSEIWYTKIDEERAQHNSTITRLEEELAKAKEAASELQENYTTDMQEWRECFQILVSEKRCARKQIDDLTACAQSAKDIIETNKHKFT